ncbi:hypothetical protein D5086_031094 [Populus alba]|uniref:Uncharacterized protein n=1 Tax=Populus alba TaxID=43335 RepID=A0ACC4ARN7_POPAL
MIHGQGFSGSRSTLMVMDPNHWINEYADLGRVILAGESAGGTIAQYVAVQPGAAALPAVAIKRLPIVLPINMPNKFWGR